MRSEMAEVAGIGCHDTGPELGRQQGEMCIDDIVRTGTGEQ
jgi:hypothetical protein